MKKILILCAAILAACSSPTDEETALSDSVAEVTLNFSPYQMETMSRAATSIADIVTHLDVWLTDGTTTATVHQTTADAAFGSITVTLDKTKTYQLYAVGHRANGFATLSDGAVISFPDDKVTHTLYYTTTFTPATTASLSCEMTRIVAQFRVEITDNIPEECKTMRFTIANVFDRWNVSTGATHSLDRVSTINYNGTSSIFNVYAIVTNEQTLHDITIEALDADEGVIQTRSFADVPLRNGYKTTYRGTFFIDTATAATFTIGDWQEYDTVNF